MSTSQKITTADWEHHRAELERLYMQEGKSLSHVRTQMIENHNFRPSKSQYETAFERLGFRKNLSVSEWKFVGDRIKKRKANNKESEVYLNNTVVSSKRVKKELSRHFTPCYRQSYTPAPSPPNIVVRTPKESATLEIHNLPWFQFQSVFDTYPNFGENLIDRIFGEGGNQLSTSSVSLPAFLDIAGLIPSSATQGSVESFMKGISLERNHGDFELSIQKLLGPFNRDAGTEFLKFVAYLSSNNMLSTDQSDRFLQGVIQTNSRSALQAFFFVETPTIAAFARCIFESALRIGDAAVLWILLKAGVDPNAHTKSYGLTPLQMVVVHPYLELAHILLDQGADINGLSSDDGELTALYHAVSGDENNVEIVQWLLDEGADVNYCVDKSVLEYALYPRCGSYFCVDPDVFRILLNAGANVETPVQFEVGRTALQAAAESGNVELFQLLLDAGANVNAPAAPSYSCCAGGTVLQEVAGGGDHGTSIELAQMLLDAGADINAPAPSSHSSWKFGDGGEGITALQGAAKVGSAEMVQMLLDAGADVNAEPGLSDNGCGMTALQAAARCGSVEIVRMLLAVGAEVNARAFIHDLSGNDGNGNSNNNPNRQGITALQEAVSSGNVELVKILLDAGADINAHAGSNEIQSKALTALERAAKRGSVELVQMLLDAGADIYVSGYSIMESAVEAEEHNDELVRALLAACANTNGDYERALIIASRNGDIGLVDLFLAAGANIDALNRENQNAIGEAVEKSRKSMVQFLLDAGAKVNCTLLVRRSLFSNDINLVQMPLDAGAPVDEVCGSSSDRWVTNALPVAAYKGNIEIVRLLIDAGADVNASAHYESQRWSEDGDTNPKEDGVVRTALVGAVWLGRVDIVKVLISAGANVNARPQSPSSWTACYERPKPTGGWTALQAATHTGNTSLVHILRDAGADINAPAYRTGGRTALQAAIVEGHTELARSLFLEAGADAHAPAAESRGVTALQAAAIKGQLGIAHMLLEAGADPNAPAAKKKGRTALQGAAEHGRLDMVQLLLNAGADTSHGERMRASELAKKNGHVVVAKFLENLMS